MPSDFMSKISDRDFDHTLPSEDSWSPFVILQPLARQEFVHRKSYKDSE